MTTRASMPVIDRGRVWILEDSPLEAEMARRALTSSQDVEIFTDGSVLLERIATGIKPPDAIVLDWQLPGISGVEVCHVVRATHDAMSLPILMLTGHSEENDVVEGLAAGANDYVVKPYHVAEVVARVSTLVRTSRLQRAQVRRAQQLALGADMGEAITSCNNLDEIAKRLTEAIAKHLDGSLVEVWEWRQVEGDNALRLSATTGAEAPRTTAVADVPQAADSTGNDSGNGNSHSIIALPLQVIRQVAVGQKPFVSDDPAAIAALFVGAGGGGGHKSSGGHHHSTHSMRGFAALPLVVRQETQGVVAFCSRIAIGDALPALMTIADLVALGMARVRLEGERAQMHQAERSARAEAEAANRSKDEFLAMISHELRTPLNAITGWTGMLLGGTLDVARQRRALETIDRSARSQAQLIDDLLDVGRIVAGNLRVDEGIVNVSAVGEMALEAVRLSADSKGVALETQIDPAAGQIKGDADRIQQIIANLLTNAIKFTPKGGRVLVVIRQEQQPQQAQQQQHGTFAEGVALGTTTVASAMVTEAAIEPQPRRVEIRVEDSGQGISADFLPHVFERFRQADGTITRAKGGLGLGLAIVKHLVELHGGRIEAKSGGLGLGSSFVVTLPVPTMTSSSSLASSPAPSTSSSAPPPLPSQPPPPLDPAASRPLRTSFARPREVEGLRVLVVDDEPDARELLRMLLESCKMIVTTASSAAEAFDIVKSKSVDSMISDIALPGEDGLSLIRRVRELTREEGGQVPAVALTAHARTEDRARSLRAGFNSHVAKPVDPSELLAVLVGLTKLL